MSNYPNAGAHYVDSVLTRWAHTVNLLWALCEFANHIMSLLWAIHEISPMSSPCSGKSELTVSWSPPSSPCKFRVWFCNSLKTHVNTITTTIFNFLCYQQKKKNLITKHLSYHCLLSCVLCILRQPLIYICLFWLSYFFSLHFLFYDGLGSHKTSYDNFLLITSLWD